MSNVADAEKIFASDDYSATFAEYKDDGTTLRCRLRCRAVLWSKMRGRTYIPTRQCTHAAKQDPKQGKATHCHTHSDKTVDDRGDEKLVWDLTKLLDIDNVEAAKLVEKYGAK